MPTLNVILDGQQGAARTDGIKIESTITGLLGVGATVACRAALAGAPCDSATRAQLVGPVPGATGPASNAHPSIDGMSPRTGRFGC
jgi:hypothetical protein